MKTKLKQVWMMFKMDYKLMLLTFEIFWIVVFLLDRLHGQSNGSIPRFVYVSF